MIEVKLSDDGRTIIVHVAIEWRLRAAEIDRGAAGANGRLIGAENAGILVN